MKYASYKKHISTEAPLTEMEKLTHEMGMYVLCETYIFGSDLVTVRFAGRTDAGRKDVETYMSSQYKSGQKSWLAEVSGGKNGNRTCCFPNRNSLS